MFKLFLGCTFFFLLAGCSTPQNMRVRRLAVVDEKGIERLVLTTGDAEGQMNGQSFQRRSPASGLILKNAKGDEIGGIAMLDDGTTAIILDGYSKDGAYERVALYTLPNGMGGIRVNDTKGKTRVKVGVDEKMNAILELAGEDEKTRVSTMVSPEGKVKINGSK